MSLFPFHFWRIVSPEIEFAIDSSLLSALEKFVLLPSGLYRFRWEIHCHFNWCSPIDNSNFSLGTFSISSLSLVFRSLIMMCLGMDLLGFIVFEVCSTSYQIWDVFSYCFSMTFSSSQSFFPFTKSFTWTSNHVVVS